MDNKNTMDKALYLPEAQVMNLLSQVEDLTGKLEGARKALEAISNGKNYRHELIPRYIALAALQAIEKKPRTKDEGGK